MRFGGKGFHDFVSLVLVSRSGNPINPAAAMRKSRAFYVSCLPNVKRKQRKPTRKGRSPKRIAPKIHSERRVEETLEEAKNISFILISITDFFVQCKIFMLHPSIALGENRINRPKIGFFLQQLLEFLYGPGMHRALA
jgi:hypothetical protein